MKGKTTSFVDDFEHRISTMRAYLTRSSKSVSSFSRRVSRPRGRLPRVHVRYT